MSFVDSDRRATPNPRRYGIANSAEHHETLHGRQGIRRTTQRSDLRDVTHSPRTEMIQIMASREAPHMG
ncbi:MAG: hypothetical protein KF901_11560 [Myxococcales bacterium]|nr:hypothetical protein [Myxococcales bacterium]